MKIKKKVINAILLISLVLLVALSCLLIIKPRYRSIKHTESRLKNINISEGQTVEKELTIIDDKITAFMFYSKATYSGIKLQVQILDDNEDLIYNNYFYSVYSESNNIVLKNPILNKKGSTYKMLFTLLESEKNITLKGNNDKKISVDTLVSTRNYRTFIVTEILLFINVIALFAINRNKIKLEIKKGFIKWPLYFSLCLLFAIYIMYLTYAGEFTNNGLSIICIPILLFLITLVSHFAMSSYNNKISYERLFLIIGIPIITFFCIFSKPLQANDELHHYYRAYATASGTIVISKDGIDVPSVYQNAHSIGTSKTIIEKIFEKTDYNDTIHLHPATSTYNPLLYIVPTIVIFFSKLFSINFILSLYIIKILQSIVALLVGYYSIKLMPKHKLLMLVYLLMPYRLVLVTSASYDATIINAMTFLIAYFLNIRENKNKTSIFDYILFIILGYLALSGKPIYFPILLLLLFLCRKKIKNKKQILIIFCSIIMIALLYQLSNNLLISKNITSMSATDPIISGPTGINYAITHLLSTIRAFINYTLVSPIGYLFNMIGYTFVWESQSFPTTLPLLYLIVMVLAAIRDEGTNTYTRIEKILMVLVYFIVLGLAFIAMYIFMYRSNMLLETVWGVHGRYLIPAFIFPLMCLPNISKLSVDEKRNKTICLFIIVYLLYVFYFILLAAKV